MEIPAGNNSERQRIIPDGCIEMAFILGDDIKRYTTGNNFIIQPRAMIIGQTVDPFYIQPTGYVNTFGIRFYPYGFSNFVSVPIKTLSNTETPLAQLFGETAAKELETKNILARNTQERIDIIEPFLLNKISDKGTIDNIVKNTIDILLSTKGNSPIIATLKADISKRRQLERKFVKQIGVSPKQLGKIIRLQSALKLMLNQKPESLTKIAYESEYYDQAHFIKDFKEFTGTNPKDFLKNEQLILSTLFYTED